MGDVSQVATSISAAIDQASRCETTETSDSYDELGARVDTLERQAHQAEMVTAIISSDRI